MSPLLRRVLACAGLPLMLSSSSLMAADADWLRARDAFRAGQDIVLAEATADMGSSVLSVYGEFWQLWRRLKAASPDDMHDFLKRHDGDYLAEKLRAGWLRQLAKNQDWPTFLQEYPHLVDTSDTELACLNQQAHLATGDDSGLAALRDSLWFTAKDQVAACDPVIAAMQARGLITDEQRWQRLRLALDANASGLSRFLLQSLGSDLSADDLRKAQDTPQSFIDSADFSRRDMRELAAWAYGRWAKLDPVAALASLQQNERSLFDQAPVAWRQIALVAARRFDPGTEDWFKRSEAAWWPDVQVEIRLRNLVRQGQWADYLKRYAALPARLHDSRSWQYWQARALAETGSASAAKAIFTSLASQDDYYGLLSADRIGQKPGALPAPVSISDDDRAQLAQNAGFQRALALYNLGARWEAASEWNWAVRQADDHLLLAAAERAEQVGWYDRAIYAAERTHNVVAPRYLYLSPYRDITRGYATDMGLDEAWVYGLIRQESRFAPAARSGVGAGGLMQLMPSTAQWSANQLGISLNADAGNVDQNVRLGTFYLNHILTELGNPVLATAGYNAGPRRARDWQPDADLDATRFIESIPYSETREYVKKVMANTVHYARLFGRGETQLTARLGTIPSKANTVLPIDGP